MWGNSLDNLEAQLRAMLGTVFDELSPDSRRCLLTYLLWEQLVPDLDSRCDGSSVLLGLKALEIELRDRAFTSMLFRAIRADLEANRFSDGAADILRTAVAMIKHSRPPSLGQCATILRGLQGARMADPAAFYNSETGIHLAGLSDGMRLLDRWFVSGLQQATLVRNQCAHEVVEFTSAAKIQPLLFGGTERGLLRHIICCSMRWDRREQSDLFAVSS